MDEVLDDGFGGGIQLVHGTEEGDAAVEQENHAVGELARQLHVVRDHDRGNALPPSEFQNEIGDGDGHDRVDHRRGLIKQDGFGLGGQRPGDGHRALHTRAQVRRHQVLHVLELHELEQLIDPLLDAVFVMGSEVAQGALPQRIGDVFADRERVKQRAGLEDHGDAPANLDQLLLGHP